MTQPPAPRRARHLIDPNAPRVQASKADIARLERVQQWVLSILIATTLFHLAVGLVIAGLYVDREHAAAQIGLCLLAGVVGVAGIAAAFGIHHRSLVSPWLLIGLVPTAVGLFILLR